MIEVQGLSKTIGEVRAVQDVSFVVYEGEGLALVGPSGSGKTTVLRLLAGLEVPDAGTISIGGRVASEPGWTCPPHERGLGMVFQRPGLWPHMTVEENVRFGVSDLASSTAKARVEETLRLVRAEGFERRYPHQLSGGEAQRVALARALAPRPRLLLLDEPLVGLDAELSTHVLEIIAAALRHLGTTLIYVSHDLREAAAVTSRFVCLRLGRVEREGRWQATMAGVAWP